MNCEMTFSKTDTKGFSDWFNICLSAKQDRKSINGYINIKKLEAQSIDDKVNLSIARSIQRDMDDKVKKAYELTMYEFGSISGISEKDINACLTDRQAEVVLLNQKMNFKEIATVLGISPKTVYETYKEGLSKLIKYKEKVEADLPTNLSEQQLEIYKLYQTGCKPKEISKRLSISSETVYKQLNRIKQKTMTK